MDLRQTSQKFQAAFLSARFICVLNAILCPPLYIFLISAMNVGNYLQHSKIEIINSTERTNIQVEAVIHAQSP